MLVEFDRLFEISRGALGIAAVAEGEAAVEIGLAVLRVELDRLVEIGGRAIGVALGAIGLAAFGVGVGLLLFRARFFDNRCAVGDADVGRLILLAIAQLDLFRG